MGLEVATHINQLVSTNPLGTDSKSQGDDHIRLMKSVLVTDLPNIGGVVTAAHTDLNKTATLDSGLYNPVFSNLVNNTAPAAITSFVYMRIGDIVFTYGWVLVNITNPGFLATMDLTIPIVRAANWGDANSAVGHGFNGTLGHSQGIGPVVSIAGVTDKVTFRIVSGSQDGSYPLNFAYKLS